MARRNTNNEKITGNERELCRMLDLVVKGVEALKVAATEGNLNSEKSETETTGAIWKRVWCPDVLWASDDRISDIVSAKLALKRIKGVKNNMDLLLTSLDEAVKTMSNLVIQDSRENGLVRLPDDVLARIFELCHLREVSAAEEDQPKSPRIFSLVCRRFYNIAIHLPCLWRNVSPKLSEHSLMVYTSRSHVLSVDIPTTPWEEDKILISFLDRIHPHDQWKELRLRYFSNLARHTFFKLFSPRKHSSGFDALRSLAIENHASVEESEELSDEEDDEEDGGGNGESEELSDEEDGEGNGEGINMVDGEGDEGVEPLLMIEADELTLASWRCPNLVHLKLRNYIPCTGNFIPCPNVTRLELVFYSRDSRFMQWDLSFLRNLLQSIPKLESLDVNLDGDLDFISDTDVVPRTLALPHLRTLQMQFSAFSRSKHIGDFLNILDTDGLTSLHLEARLDRGGGMERECDEWMFAIFSRPHRHANCGCTRTRYFTNVADFSLIIRSDGSILPMQIKCMFEALPNVQHLSLTLPEHFDIDLISWMKEFDGLRELHTMHIEEDRPRASPSKYTRFFGKFSKMDQWKKFEELGVVCSSDLSFHAEDLECVGEKLVWIEP